MKYLTYIVGLGTERGCGVGSRLDFEHVPLRRLHPPILMYRLVSTTSSLRIMSSRHIPHRIQRRNLFPSLCRAIENDCLDHPPHHHPHEKHDYEHHARKRLKTIVPIIILGFMPIVCFGLGTWQVRRLKWKLNLIEDLEDKMQRAPISLPRNVKSVRLKSTVIRH